MLDTVALIILIVAALILFYGIIVIHDIPYEIAEHRKHPHADAIHIAGWVSLLTLHVIWPFLWIWASLYREDRGWGFNKQRSETNSNQDIESLRKDLTNLSAQVETLKQQLSNKEG